MPILKRVTVKDFPEQDKGVLVREALKLVKDSPFIDDIMEEFNISEIEHELIVIPGAYSLVRSVLLTESKVEKIENKGAVEISCISLSVIQIHRGCSSLFI